MADRLLIRLLIVAVLLPFHFQMTDKQLGILSCVPADISITSKRYERVYSHLDWLMMY
jgi:hypothetical protein